MAQAGPVRTAAAPPQKDPRGERGVCWHSPPQGSELSHMTSKQHERTTQRRKKARGAQKEKQSSVGKYPITDKNVIFDYHCKFPSHSWKEFLGGGFDPSLWNQSFAKPVF